MKEKIDSIVTSLNDKIHPDLTLNDLEALRVEYLGKNGILTSQMSLIRTLPNEEKPKFGQWINDAKLSIEHVITEQKNILLTKAMNEQLKKKHLMLQCQG
nr:hypothetical protein QOL21_01475 [Acholeplasma laidlawii]